MFAFHRKISTQLNELLFKYKAIVNYFAGDKSWPTDTNHNFNEFDSNTAYHHPNSIYHNHQLAPNANLHVLPSPHHPAALAPQDYYHLYYHPSSTAGTLRLNSHIVIYLFIC